MRTILSLLLLLSFGSINTFAHGDNSHYSNKQDIKVTTTKVSGNVYMLQGRGGNIGAVVGTDGILIVDDDYKAVSQKLSDALKELGSANPRFIFNTHWHGESYRRQRVFRETVDNRRSCECAKTAARSTCHLRSKNGAVLCICFTDSDLYRKYVDTYQR